MGTNSISSPLRAVSGLALGLPTVLYRPAVGPTPALLLAPVPPAGVLLLAGWLAWRDHIAW